MNNHFVKIGENLSVNMLCRSERNCAQILGKRQVSSIFVRSTDEYEIIEIISG